MNDEGTIFSQLFSGVRKNLVSQKMGPKQFAEEVLGTTHNYLNRVEAGRVRLPSRSLLAESSKEISALLNDPWGDLLLHVYDLVANDTLCSGTTWIGLPRILSLIASFNYVKYVAFPTSTLRLKDFQKAETKKKNASRWQAIIFEELISSATARSLSANTSVNFSRTLKRRRNEATNAFLEATQKSSQVPTDISEFVIFGRNLLILNFATTPLYLTDRNIVLQYRDLFYNVKQHTETVYHLALGDVSTEEQ